MLNSDFIVGGAGAVIALLFGYFPALRVKFAALSPEWKSGVMIGMMVITAGAVWSAGCLGWIDPGIACKSDSIWPLIKLIGIAIISNQATNRIAPETNDVKLAKVLRNLPDQSGTVYTPETIGAADVAIRRDINTAVDVNNRLNALEHPDNIITSERKP